MSITRGKGIYKITRERAIIQNKRRKSFDFPEPKFNVTICNDRDVSLSSSVNIMYYLPSCSDIFNIILAYYFFKMIFQY
jgi:predicted component of viral defense system (DUF524 family)